MGYESYQPFASARELLLYMGFASMFFLASCLVTSLERIRIVLIALIFVACAQTLFGMINYYSGEHPFGWSPTHYAAHRVTGSYINRNFFANLLVLCGGLAFAGLLISASRRQHPDAREDALNQALRNLALVAAAILIGSGVVMSGSKGGLVSLVAAFGMVMILGLVGRAGVVRLWKIGVVAAGSIVLFGFDLMQQRWAALTSTSGARAEQWSATWELIMLRPMFGYGPGSYEEAYRTKVPLEATPLTHNHAHSDILELLLEQGFLGALPLGVFIALILSSGLVRAVSTRSKTRLVYLAACLFGIVGMLVHSVYDFPFQVPANSMIFFVLASMLQTTVHLKGAPANGQPLAERPLTEAAPGVQRRQRRRRSSTGSKTGSPSTRRPLHATIQATILRIH